MAGLIWHVHSDDVSLSAGVPKTALQVAAPANQRLVLRQVRIYCKGQVTTDAPIKVRLLRQTVGTSVAATTPTPYKRDPTWDETLRVTAKAGFTTEPTPGDVLHMERLHPQTGKIESLNFGDEIPIPAGTLLGIEFTADQAQTVMVTFIGDE